MTTINRGAQQSVGKQWATFPQRTAGESDQPPPYPRTNTTPNGGLSGSLREDCLAIAMTTTTAPGTVICPTGAYDSYHIAGRPTLETPPSSF